MRQPLTDGEIIEGETTNVTDWYAGTGMQAITSTSPAHTLMTSHSCNQDKRCAIEC